MILQIIYLALTILCLSFELLADLKRNDGNYHVLKGLCIDLICIIILYKSGFFNCFL